MPMHRRNRCKPRMMSDEQPWFKANVIRQRMRKKMAKLSRRKNRDHN